MTEEMPEDIPDDVAQLLVEGNDLFDTMCRERHEAGAETYGMSWVGNDTLQMALEEIADLANYARYTFCKVYAMKIKIEEAIAEQTLGAASD